MAKKTNLKSVRISDEVLTYIENFEGNGFNQKFENLVLFCMREEKRKRIEIQNLDNLINLRYKKDRAIFDLQREAALTIKQLISMQHDLEKLQKYMNIIRTPVSYTHLDVYKRQILGCSTIPSSAVSNSCTYAYSPGK